MSRMPATGWPGRAREYRDDCNRPRCLPTACASRAVSAASSGATALVPPITVRFPSTRTWYPVAGSALPATSGTPRPGVPAGLAGTPAVACHAGRGNVTLTPPPVAPPPAPWFHTFSDVMTPVDGCARRLVPPQASACGLEAGKSVCGLPSLAPSLLPLSPAAAVTVTPSAAPSAMAWSRAVIDCCVQELSAAPQLMLTAAGVGSACTAVVTASTNP